MAHQRLTRTSLLFSCAFLVALASPASAANFTFTGSLFSDDDVKLFALTLGNPGMVTMETVSFAGGGFDPVLTLFDQSGLIVDQNDDGPSPSDSQLISNLSAGTYYLAISQFDNFPIGPLLFDGFTRDGQGNFTADACGVAGGSFYTLDPCEQRTSAFTINVLDVDTAAVVPEPSTLGLILLGIAGGVYRIRRRQSRQ